MIAIGATIANVNALVAIAVTAEQTRFASAVNMANAAVSVSPALMVEDPIRQMTYAPIVTIAITIASVYIAMAVIRGSLSTAAIVNVATIAAIAQTVNPHATMERFAISAPRPKRFPAMCR